MMNREDRKRIFNETIFLSQLLILFTIFQYEFDGKLGRMFEYGALIASFLMVTNIVTCFAGLFSHCSTIRNENFDNDLLEELYLKKAEDHDAYRNTDYQRRKPRECTELEEDIVAVLNRILEYKSNREEKETIYRD